MDEMQKSANLSSCGDYRYRLIRKWDIEKPVATFVMLNPSVADAEIDDPTIRRCVGFAQRWGCGAIVVVNLFGWRSTDPKGLRDTLDPVGPNNDGWIRYAMQQGDIVVFAWGNHGKFKARQLDVFRLAEPYAIKVQCLGLTKSGQPKHPLFVPYDTELVEFKPLIDTHGKSGKV